MLRKTLVLLALVFFGLSVWAQLSGHTMAAQAIMLSAFSCVFLALASKMFSWLWR